VQRFSYHEHLAFDRAFNVEDSVFEFFVAPDFEDDFLRVMLVLEKAGMVFDLKNYRTESSRNFKIR